MLTLIIFLPLLFALAICVLPARQAKQAALVGTGLLLTLTLLVGFGGQFQWGGIEARSVSIGAVAVDSAFQLRQSAEWIPDLGITYIVGVDGFSMAMLILSAVLAFVAVLASWTTIHKREKEFYAHLFVLLTGLFGSFVALDLFLFYIFFEVMLIPLYFLVGIWGGTERRSATLQLIVYTLVGSVLMLVAILWMYANNGVVNPVTGDFEGVRTYSYELMVATQAGKGALASFAGAPFIFLALAFGFCVKLAMFPFHSWQPIAYAQAPTAVTVLLAGAVLKTGGYGLIRFAVPLFPDSAVALAPLFLWLGAISIVYGAALAIVQTDLKQLIAYSSISHMGFVLVGIFSFNSLGMQGAMIQLLNHGISVTGLFLVIGYLEERRGTRLLSEFGGLAGRLPVLAALAMVMLLSSVALPGLNGFIGEFNILLGAMKAEPIIMTAQQVGSFHYNLYMTEYSWVIAALAGSGVILAAVYLLRMYAGVFFGKLDEEKNGKLVDLSPREWSPLAVFAVLALVIGLFPQPIFRAFEVTKDAALSPSALVLAESAQTGPGAVASVAVD